MNLAPLRNATENAKPWEGDIKKKPWEYEITAIIPVIDTYEPLLLIIKLLKLQTIKPYIVIIDTGSLPENRWKIESLQDESTEVHSLKLNSVQHPSDFVAMACDLGAAVCRTEYMFYTHADCFLMRQNVLENMLNLCKENPIVLYRLTQIKFEGWEKMWGHTLLMMNTKTYLENRLLWNLKQFEYYYDLQNHFPDDSRQGYPDTEIMINCICQDLNIKPLIIGDEENYKRNQNEDFDHCRTFTSGLLYAKDYYNICKEWMKNAMNEAEERIKKWESDAIS